MSVMKNFKNTVYLSILAIFLISLNCTAQVVNCSENYEAALKLYNYGMADSALNVLRPCLGNTKAMSNITNETSAKIFRLAALASIMKGDPGRAEEYVRQLLKYQPDYKNNLTDDDLMEFRMMVSKTYSQPDLRLGVIGGVNMPFLALQKKYSAYETAFNGNYSLERSIGYQFGFSIEKTLSKKFSLNIEAGITQILFKYSVAASLGNEYSYNQNLRYVEIPIVIKYYITTGHFKPYLQAGLTGRISLNKIEKSDTYGRYWFTNSSNSEKILTTFMTDFEKAGLVLGGGIGYDMKKINLVLDFRYNHNFKSSKEISKFDNVAGYDAISPDEKFYYTDDISLINIRYIQISIGFLYNLKYKVY